MILTTPEKRRNAGLLLLRAGIGIMYMGHGAPKLLGGQQKWAELGSAMGNLGIHFAPAFWGAMAGCAEFFGGLLLVIGFLTRPALALISFTMVVATLTHLSGGDPFNTYSRPIEMLIVLLSLILFGAGRYSVDSKLKRAAREE